MDPRRATFRLHSSTLAGAAVLGFLSMMAGDAEGACFMPRPANQLAAPGALGKAALAMSRRLSLAAVPAEGSSNGPVVGMWRTVFTANAGEPDEFTFDEGFQQFHADGTELMVSRGVPPDLGNVCIGVWERTSDGIKLRHVTWNWAGQSDFNVADPFTDAFSNANTGYFELIVTFRVDSQGRRFSGSWEAQSFDVDDVLIPGSEFSGTVEGKRLGVNQP